MQFDPTRFNPKIGAGLLLGLGGLYLVLAVATGHSAVAEPPPDLTPKKAALSLPQTLALLAKTPADVALVDVRGETQRSLYKLPLGVVASADAKALLQRAVGRRHVVVVADEDKTALKLLGAVAAHKPAAKFHYLRGGARSWYLALELPVQLFSSKPAPHGYARALSRVKAWLPTAKAADADTLTAISRLASLNFSPNLLAGKKKPAAGGKKKKISGGCG